MAQASPARRSAESLRVHYEVEKEIAGRLRSATRAERQEIYKTMYAELFQRVPDHPRLARRRDDAATERANHRKFRIVEPFVNANTVALEIAPGDCRFATALAARVNQVIAVDISDQRGGAASPDNLKLVIYDGYKLPEVEDGSVDFAFSDQFIEHLHPEDARLHLELVHRVLKPGGVYLIRMPHAYSGPHDVSMYFSEHPEGFHLKEWDYSEFLRVLSDVGFGRLDAFWNARRIAVPVPRTLLDAVEGGLRQLPRRYSRRLSKYLLPCICVAAHKAK